MASPAAAGSGGLSAPLLLPVTDPDAFYGKGPDAVPKATLFDTSVETGLTTEEAERRIGLFGPNELVEKTVSPWVKLVKEFTGPMPIMIWLAILVEAIIKDVPDLLILLFLQLLNGFVGWYEDYKAGNAVAALKAALKPEAQVKRDGIFKTINASLLVPGDIITLSAGAAVPADCEILPGALIEVDQAALTGESLPVTMRAGDVAKMGSNVTRGEVEAMVCATGGETFFGKTAALIQSVDEMGHFQKIILRITFGLMGLSIVAVSITLGYLLLHGEDILEAIAFCVVLLIASIPIAMQVVCTTTMALGCRMLADEKAIVTRLTSIEQLAGMNMLCSDKTGTLTMNKMVLQDDLPTFSPGLTRNHVLQAAALAAKWKEPAKDALDTLTLNAIDLKPLDAFTQLDYMPFDPAIKRTCSTIRAPDGSVFKVTKGAPQIVLDLCKNKAEIEDAFNAKVVDLATRGIRALAVAKASKVGSEDASSTAGDTWEMMGILTFLDPPRPDTKSTIERAGHYGIEVKMITGDQQAIAIETCRVLGMGMNIVTPEDLPTGDQAIGSRVLGQDYGEIVESADGFAQVFPDHKFIIVEILRQKGWMCGMTGDGVNDAPALKRADIGVAVQGATDAACAAADIVLTAPGLSTIVTAILYSREIFQRMKNYVIYRIACTFQLLFFFFFAVTCMHPSLYWDGFDAKYFKMPVTALVIITILNDGCIISIAYDHVKASRKPEVWDLGQVFIVAIVAGSIALASSLILLDLGLDSHNPHGWFAKLGLEPLDYLQVQAMMYLKVSLSDFLTVFAARTHGPFFSRRPGLKLTIAAIVAMVTSTLLARYWPLPDMEGISWKLCALTWLYVIIWFIIQDVAKMIAYWCLFLTSTGFASQEREVADRKRQLQRSNRQSLTRESIRRGKKVGELVRPSTRMPSAPSDVAGAMTRIAELETVIADLKNSLRK
ncbi:plasma membrane H+-ATPase [Pycnococcus provasolii]|uniref:Plasma membrane ATPase n=2 Tax=Pycnococcus provasolii TaxID=41880 RepID=A0A830HAR0_9CHLO|nr:plasma membrane H+-ATPase [Pycnococcus provasolii]